MTEWADQLHHNAPALSTALVQAFFCQSITSPRSVSPLQPRFSFLRLLAFPKAKIAFEREEVCECDSHTVRKLSQRRLTAEWLALRESDCSRMHSKVSSDWLPSYIKAMRPVLEIFKMAGYFPESPHRVLLIWEQTASWKQLVEKWSRCNCLRSAVNSGFWKMKTLPYTFGFSKSV
jgi:hypothetical protein